MVNVRHLPKMLVILMLSAIAPSSADCTEIPAFLPDFYASAFDVDGLPLTLVRHSKKTNLEEYLYKTDDNTLFFSFENIETDSAKSKGAMTNIIRLMKNEMEVEGGQFIDISKNEVHAKIYNNGIKRTIFVYVLPTAIQFWTFSGVRSENINSDEKFRYLRSLANRKRYLEAQSQGNVSMGAWGPEIHEYALELLKKNNRNEALTILGKILATSPYDFAAHLDVVKNSTDADVVANSAGIILRNAEDPKITDATLLQLGKQPVSLNSIQILDPGETGLQVILIPLEPCNLSLLDGVAKTYEQITGIPVKIRRLKEPWKLNAPDRIPNQRAIQETIIKMSGEKVDFSGWNKDKYLEKLKSVAEQKDALTKYYVTNFIQSIDNEPGQYDVEPYLNLFSKILESYRSTDNNVMYV
jgi:hypothetical protein